MAKQNLQVVEPAPDEEPASPTDPPTDLTRFITIFDEQYAARSGKHLSTKERLRYESIQHTLQVVAGSIGKYHTEMLREDVEALDFETLEPPDELVEDYEHAYLRLVRWGFPEVPPDVWRKLREQSFDYVELIGDQFSVWMRDDARAMREGEQSGPPVIRLPRLRPSPASPSTTAGDSTG